MMCSGKGARDKRERKRLLKLRYEQLLLLPPLPQESL
jgi:hypothetical protein